MSMTFHICTGNDKNTIFILMNSRKCESNKTCTRSWWGYISLLTKLK